MIKIGDKIPNLVLRSKNDKIYEFNADEFFSHKRVVLFGLPGAYTSTCSSRHLPSYISLLPKIKSKGIDIVACFAVNDPHVMKAWAEHNNILDKIKMISDTDCSFSKHLGLDHDYGSVLGIRSLRFSMIINDCIIENLFVEEVGKYDISSAENIINYL